MKTMTDKDREFLGQNKARVSNKKSIINLVAERRIRDYGTTSENALMVHDTSSHEAIHKAGNHMAAFGNYPVGMSGCYIVGLNGNCGIDCPVFMDGDCKSTDGFPEESLIEYGYKEAR